MPSPKKQKPDAQPKKPLLGFLRPIDMIGIGLILVAILLYAISQCGSSSNEDLAEDTSGLSMEERRNRALQDSLRSLIKDLPVVFTVLDSVKLRSGPGLEHTMVDYLLFGDTVYYLNEFTQTTQTIRVAVEEVRTEPWIKLRTKSGKEGWAFGAGLSFYPRLKRPSPPAAPAPSPDSTRRDSSAPAPAPANTAPSGSTATPANRPANRPATTTNTRNR